MGYSEDMASFIQYRAGVGALSDVELAMLIYRLVIGGTAPTTSTGGTTTASGSVSIKSGNSAELLEVVGGKIGISNFPATQQIAGSVTIGNFPGTQQVGGTINVGNFPAIQPIVGDVSVLNFPANQQVSVSNFTSLINSTLSGGAASGVKLNPDSIFFLRDANNFPTNATFTIAAGATQSNWQTIMSPHKLLLLEVPAMSGANLQVRWRHPIGTGVANPIVDMFGTPFALTIGATGRTFSSDALAPLARCVLGDGEISFVSNVAESVARPIKLYY